MRKPIHLLSGLGLLFYTTQLQAQLCPRIVNCPQSTPTYCDYSLNDSLLWHVAPFTYSPSIGNADLHEAAIDLSLKAIGCPDGGNISISFILYLDLDADDLQETVLTSGSPPPAGRVMANNSFNPGYSGGDTVWFDRRPVPDSLKYRFTLEIAYSGDTTIGYVRYCTESDPFDFFPVQLPEGRHRIEWRMVQDANVRFCDRNFKVKDCQKPLVACHQNLEVFIDGSQTASLFLDQALAAVSDNITPDSQLLVGMRRLGAGFGFPFGAGGNPQDSVMFNCSMDTDQYIEVWAKDRENNLENCIAQVFPFDTVGHCPFVANPLACARSYWNDEPLYGVSFDITYTPPGQSPVTQPLSDASNGCAEIASLPPAGFFSLSASKDTVPLNGVTTYDLVLISRHILGFEPFDAGWKMVAADANRSNTITTLDILELRRMILGVATQLPNNTPSWRFFIDTCTVWNTPFSGNCPGAWYLPTQPLSSYQPQFAFRAVKVGDVNGTAVNTDSLQNNLAESRGTAMTLTLPDYQLKAGESLEIPVRTAEGGNWTGFQGAFAFDPSMLLIENLGAGWADIKPEHWAIPTPGICNFSWSDATPVILNPGDELFRIKITALAPVQLSRVLQLQHDDRLIPEVYAKDGAVHAMALSFDPEGKQAASDGQVVLSPRPNPTGDAAYLPLRLTNATPGLLEIIQINGSLHWQQRFSLGAGAQTLEIPASALPAAGVYVWRLQAGDQVWSGRLVKM